MTSLTRERQQLVVETRSAPQGFDGRPMTLCLLPPELGGVSGFRRAPGLGRRCGFANEVDQALTGIFAIARLAAKAIGRDHEDTVARQAATSQLAESSAYRVW